nr:MAG TPA: hypothetical protein [Caudoviricetes sp.]
MALFLRIQSLFNSFTTIIPLSCITYLIFSLLPAY